MEPLGEPGFELRGPRMITAPLIAPAQMPLARTQARSPTMMVWLAPSVMSAMRILLLR